MQSTVNKDIPAYNDIGDLGSWGNPAAQPTEPLPLAQSSELPVAQSSEPAASKLQNVQKLRVQNDNLKKELKNILSIQQILPVKELSAY